MPLSQALTRPFATYRLLACAILVFCLFSIAVVWIAGKRERDNTLQQYGSRLNVRKSINAEGLKQAIEALRNDVIFLRQVPPVDGVVRSQANNGFDTQDQTPQYLWKTRLGTIFKAYMASNPNTMQLRLIGLKNGGIEYVGVEARGKKTYVTNDILMSAETMQNDIQPTQNLREGQVYVSDIRLDREDGKVEYPYVPTIQVSTPVYDAEGNKFGVLLLKVNARILLAPLQENLAPHFRIYLTNQAGDFILYPHGKHSFGFELGRRWRWQDEFRSVKNTSSIKDIQLYASAHELIYTEQQKVIIDLNNSSRYLNIIAAIPDSVIKQAETQTRQATLIILLSGGVLIGSILYLLFRQQRRVQEQQTQLAAIVENSYDAIIGKTLEGRITTWNKGAELMFGYTAEEAVGRLLAELIMPKEALAEEADILHRVARGEGITGINTVRRRSDGTLFDVSITVSPIRNADGHIVGASTTTRDISEQKVHEAKIRAMNASLEQQVQERVAELVILRDQLLTAATVAELGIWTWHLGSNLLECNKRMCEIYEFPAAQGESSLYFQNWYSRLHPEDAEATVALLNAAVEGKATYNPVFRIVRSDGSIRYIQAAAKVERDASGVAIQVLGINRDITEQRTLETTLRLAKQVADEASQAKSAFVANMSHEIRSPMNAILGMLQLLRQTELNSRQLDYADKAESAAKALLGILNDILDFSKVEAGKLMLDPHPFSLDKLLRDMAVILSSNVGNKTIEVLFEIDPSLPNWIVGDALRLQQILLNLAGNAIKFTAQGEVVLSARTGMLPSTIDFAVRDTGIGISPSQCEQIFEGFSQAEVSTTRRFGGTGLGLAISKRLVHLMGGELRVSSTLGEGSTFYFTIPYTIANSQNIVEDNHRKQLHNLNCLVVEDNPSARQILTNMMTTFGWQVEAVDNGQDALVKVAERNGHAPYDVICVDWQMPVMDGWQTSMRIRELYSKAAPPLIVMVTAYERELIVQKQQQVDTVVDHVLVKPITASTLFDVVATAKGVVTGEPELPLIDDASRRLKELRLLLVEDNPTNQQVASELLSHEGAAVIVADNGAVAIDTYQHTTIPFDVILMDIQMPDIDGYTATRILRAQYGDALPPIIAMTANVLASDRQAALEAGMSDHVGKPFDLNELVETILRHTKRKNSSPQALSSSFERTEIKTENSWNSATALARLAGKKDVYQTVLRGFIRDAVKLCDNLKTALLAQQYPQALQHIHTLKGLAGTAGAESLSRQAAQIEQALHTTPEANQQQIEIDIQNLLKMTQQASKTAEQLLDQFNSSATSPHPPSNQAKLYEGLNQLQILLKANNLKAFEVFSQLKQNYAQTMPKEFVQIEHALEKMDFQEASRLCVQSTRSLEASVS